MTKRIFAFAVRVFMLRGNRIRLAVLLLFTPLWALMASRKPRGDAVTVAPTGRDLRFNSHPHGYQIVKVLSLLLILPSIILMNF